MGSLQDFIPRSDNPTLWRQNESGRYVMPELQSKFLDWLLTPKSEREGIDTQAAWAAANGVNSGTLGTWKKDRRFRREWEDRAAAKNISVDRVQGILDTLHEAGMQGDVQAAKLYLQHVERLAPPVVVHRDPDLQDLSEEDLDRMLEDLEHE